MVQGWLLDCTNKPAGTLLKLMLDHVVEKSGRDQEKRIQSVKMGFLSHPLGTMNIERGGGQSL